MKIRKAEIEDLNIIIDIFKNAISKMNDNNIYQWDEKYPTTTIFKQDILKKQMYVVIVRMRIKLFVACSEKYEEIIVI